jgi:hypothetical protein
MIANTDNWAAAALAIIGSEASSAWGMTKNSSDNAGKTVVATTAIGIRMVSRNW